jgi:hypothetical protein
MHRVFPPALIAAIRGDLVPQPGDVQDLAAKMWCEASPVRALQNWHDLPRGSIERQRLIRAAEIALNGVFTQAVPLAA